MTLRLRLTVCFAVLLGLGAVNTALHFRSNQLRDAGVEALTRSVRRQAILQEMRESMSGRQQQIRAMEVWLKPA